MLWLVILSFFAVTFCAVLVLTAAGSLSDRKERELFQHYMQSRTDTRIAA